MSLTTFLGDRSRLGLAVADGRARTDQVTIGPQRAMAGMRGAQSEGVCGTPLHRLRKPLTVLLEMIDPENL